MQADAADAEPIETLSGERDLERETTQQGEPLDDPARLHAEATAGAAAEEELPRPPGWRGYELMPRRIQFWHGNSDRPHRRLLYVRSGDGWTHQRLQP